MIDAVLSPGDVAWVAIDREIVVHHPASSTAYVLDPTAAALWQCLDGESTLGEVLADLAEVVGIPLSEVERAVVPVVKSWIDAGLAVNGASGDQPADPPTLRTWRRLVAPPNG